MKLSSGKVGTIKLYSPVVLLFLLMVHLGRVAGEEETTKWCSKRGQLCGRLNYKMYGFEDVKYLVGSLQAKFWVDCCKGFKCDIKFTGDGASGGLCKPDSQSGSQDCVGKHMPCGSWKDPGNDAKLECCSDMGLKCDTKVKFEKLEGGFCTKPTEEFCMAAGLPCGKYKNDHLKCCGGMKCTQDLQISSIQLSGGFCKPHKAREAKDDNYKDLDDKDKKEDKEGGGKEKEEAKGTGTSILLHTGAIVTSLVMTLLFCLPKSH